MKVLIVSATKLEIGAFAELYPEAEVLISGIGLPRCLFSLTKQLMAKRYDWVIQAGIAGSFDERLTLGDVFVVKKDRFADIGMLEKGSFQTISEAGLSDGDEFPFSNDWLVNDYLVKLPLQFPMVNGITVNTVTDQPLPFSFSLNNTIESMEGAALHYVCLQLQIPFLQIRSISNKVGDRNKSNWKIKESIVSLQEALMAVYDNLQ